MNKHIRESGVFRVSILLLFSLIAAQAARADPNPVDDNRPGGREAVRYFQSTEGEQVFPFFEKGCLRFNPARVSTAGADLADFMAASSAGGKADRSRIPIRVRGLGYTPSAYPSPDRTFTPGARYFTSSPRGLSLRSRRR